MGNMSGGNTPKLEVYSTDHTKSSNIQNYRVRHTHTSRPNHDLINTFTINKPSRVNDEVCDNGGWTT